DYVAIADQVSSFDRVIVECHPAVLLAHSGELCLKFRDLIRGQLEVAVGLETVHTEVLEKLNKRMTIDLFRRAADFLGQNEIDLRVFILLKPPFLDEAEGLSWACRSIDFALECKARVAVIIPTRGGNGAMEAIDSSFIPPTLQSLEKAHEYGLSLKQGRVFVDLWDAEKFSRCECDSMRIKRLDEMNRSQVIADEVKCERCNS
ncbi:MAG TPA: radical SAM protein, partial [Blastocatellia bacterium]|nr:radical SAM protein [Blastocatellia bacterium]